MFSVSSFNGSDNPDAEPNQVGAWPERPADFCVTDVQTKEPDAQHSEFGSTKSGLLRFLLVWSHDEDGFSKY